MTDAGVSRYMNLTPTPGMQVTASKDLSGGVKAGDAINQAIDYVPGTAHGNEADVLVDGESQVYGASQDAFYDGTNYNETALASMPPSDFDTDPGSVNPDDFATWHSAYQAEYLKKHQSSDGAEVDIGSGSNTIHVVLADSGNRAFILDSLQKTDIAKLSVLDQQRIAASSYFTSTLAPTLNLTTDSSTALAAITSLIGTINGAKTATTAGDNGMTADEKQPFLDQLNLLTSQLSRMAIFSQQDISNDVTAISKRFTRASTFSLQQKFVTVTRDLGTISLPIPNAGQVSTDNNATIANGYKAMIAQEKQIRDVAVAADRLAQNATISGQHKDAPALIFYFQLYANLSQEAAINADTEEVKQLNALLNLYSQMQGLLQQTLETFGTKSDEKKSLLDKDKVTDLSTATPSQQTIAYIFDDFYGSYRAHPLETLYGIQKPTFDIMDSSGDKLNDKLKDSWNSFNSSLSNTVSQLNQQSQILMDGINSATKQKDRHFDLSNNALSKVADMVQSIGRNVG